MAPLVRTPRWTPPSTGRRAHRRRRSGRRRRIPTRPDRASHPCRTRPGGRCATTSTPWPPHDPPNAPRSHQAASRCAGSSTHRPLRGPSSRRHGPRPVRSRTGASGVGMPKGRGQGQGLGGTTRRWLRRAGIRWMSRRPSRRRRGSRGRRRRSGARAPSGPGRSDPRRNAPDGPGPSGRRGPSGRCRRRVAAPGWARRRHRSRRRSRRGGGAGSGWWRWC